MKRQRAKMSEEGYTRLATKDSDDSSEETELSAKKPTFQEIPTVEKVVEDGDTLQALSIRYHCPIAELKRLNNIHRENEIFAKNTIKVPARPFSVALASVHTSGTSSPKEQSEVTGIDTDILSLKLSRELLNTPKQSSDINSSVEVNSVIFNSNVKPINKVCDNSPLTEVHLHEEVRLLPPKKSLNTTVLNRLSCDGADAGISWIALIICIVIVIVAAPLIYVLYIAEHPEQYYHSHI
ncbi:hypothetical protein PPYR_04557 [Photinus pyralis]|uniref:LysM domain-containing protein n=2 Tax=Photinus pyralis TaxID=7054 RepID=A0A5N4AYD6_PHOPY|nr:lysM and putative peptidoglycan-binding domain-containing protein 3 [Photinus pyralis]KAB0802371.1 hypothetical protein PPYR_04557 [Photinus pyralis]